jgi:hypothetical protein
MRNSEEKPKNVKHQFITGVREPISSKVLKNHMDGSDFHRLAAQKYSEYLNGKMEEEIEAERDHSDSSELHGGSGDESGDEDEAEEMSENEEEEAEECDLEENLQESDSENTESDSGKESEHLDQLLLATQSGQGSRKRKHQDDIQFDTGGIGVATGATSVATGATSVATGVATGAASDATGGSRRTGRVRVETTKSKELKELKKSRHQAAASYLDPLSIVKGQRFQLRYKPLVDLANKDLKDIGLSQYSGYNPGEWSNDANRKKFLSLLKPVVGFNPDSFDDLSQKGVPADNKIVGAFGKVLERGFPRFREEKKNDGVWTVQDYMAGTAEMLDRLFRERFESEFKDAEKDDTEAAVCSVIVSAAIKTYKSSVSDLKEYSSVFASCLNKALNSAQKDAAKKKKKLVSASGALTEAISYKSLRLKPPFALSFMLPFPIQWSANNCFAHSFLSLLINIEEIFSAFIGVSTSNIINIRDNDEVRITEKLAAFPGITNDQSLSGALKKAVEIIQSLQSFLLVSASLRALAFEFCGLRHVFEVADVKSTAKYCVLPGIHFSEFLAHCEYPLSASSSDASSASSDTSSASSGHGTRSRLNLEEIEVEKAIQASLTESKTPRFALCDPFTFAEHFIHTFLFAFPMKSEAFCDLFLVHGAQARCCKICSNIQDDNVQLTSIPLYIPSNGNKVSLKTLLGDLHVPKPLEKNANIAGCDCQGTEGDKVILPFYFLPRFFYVQIQREKHVKNVENQNQTEVQYSATEITDCELGQVFHLGIPNYFSDDFTKQLKEQSFQAIQKIYFAPFSASEPRAGGHYVHESLLDQPFDQFRFGADGNDKLLPQHFIKNSYLSKLNNKQLVGIVFKKFEKSKQV